MTFIVSDFEDATTGTLPGDYSGFTENTGPTEVSTDSPIEGDKSALFRDEGSGWTGIRHPVGDESVIFALDVNRDTELVSDFRQIGLGVRDSSDNYPWHYLLADDGSGDFEIYFDTNLSERQNRESSPFGDLVATVSVGFHLFELQNPSSNLELVIDGTVEHSSGQSFSGAQEFEWSSDDMEVRIDRSVDFSQLVFHLGDPVVLGANDQNFVFERVSTNRPISDRGPSNAVFIDGAGVDFDN